MAVATAKDLLLEVDLPKEVWGRSGRPTRGNMVRWFGFAMFALLGLALPWIGVKVIMIAGALAAGLGLPWFADQRLGAIEAEVAAATKSNAASLLGGLEERRLVALFAPHGWVALQKARLHLLAGDGRAGARALSECGRLCGEPKHPALLSGQARGFVISGDRAEARKLLTELAGGDSMTPRDHLDYGTILLGESGRAKQAREEIERAAEAVGEHPQTDAALAIVRTRDDKLEEAGELLERAEAADDVESDVVAQDLIKKARKTLRPALKDAKKGIGGAGRRGKRTQPASDAGRGGRKKGRGKKKDKRKERREKRKAGRAKASGKHDALRPDAADEAALEDDANPAAEAAADQAAADQAAAEKAAAEKAAADKAAADKAAADKAAAEKAAADKAAAEKAAADKAAADKAAADKAAADKAAADKAAADKAASDQAAEKAAADKAAADKAAADKAAADKAAADKAAADKAAADKAAATPAPPKLNSLFGNKPAGGKPLFKAPPLPKVGSGTGSRLSFPKPAAPKAGGMAKPKAPSLGAKPVAPAAPSVAPKAPPKVAAPKIAPPKVASAGDDDGWGDFLDDVEPPAKPKQD